MSKGDTPLKFTDLRSKLLPLWNMIGKWSMVSLGKGFYEFSFASLEDMRMICAIGSWSLKPGFLRMFLWTPDFNPALQKQSHTQCWVKIHNLPQEYWNPRILFSIAGGIGTPISLDEATHNRTFGHFAKVLVELNLKSNLPDQILVERDNFAFFVAIEYENLPAFCHHCQAIGHNEVQCRKNNNAKPDGTGKPRVKKQASEEVVKNHDMPHLDKGEGEIKISDLVIDLEVERNDNLMDMVNPESPKDRNQSESPGSSEGIPESVEENEANPCDNAIVQETAEIANLVAANDMRIIGKLWADDEGCSEEETFTTVLSKSKKKKLRRRSNTEKIHYTRRGGLLTNNQ
ncbi:PREDICTED: uncharacterized protein LOC109356305 [Lupinus angustifolius]|uniref:uncharacterized protein LOC109356305 n=1 Tax=Lupinus angustifolius TaxID=3871 RepID=UPI00092EEA6B|nr:PREDICTED: uncharacterized protein LOC109356305 [Lupinus angustifolius]